MRNKLFACIVAATAVAAIAALPAVAKPKKGKTVKCNIVNFQQHAPSASGPGDDFGFINCSGPFGKGVQYDTFTLAPKTMTSGNAELKFKAYFNTGTVSGIWKATYQFTSTTTAIFTQKHVTWTGGTGAFKGVKATGSGTGMLDGKTGHVHQTLTLTSI